MSDSEGSNGAGTDDAKVPMAQAIAFIKADRLNEAKAICDRLVESNGDDVDALYVLGWVAHCQQDANIALSRFKRVIELKPDHARAHYNLGTILRDGGDMTAASGHFEAAIAADPDFAEAHSNLGTILMDGGDMTAASGHFEAAIAADPDFAEAHSNLGTIRLRQGEGSAALAALQKAVDLSPDNPDMLSNLGQALYEQDSHKEAEAVLKKALQLKPDSVGLLALFARINTRRGAFEAGEQLMQKAISLAPNNHRLSVGLGDLYLVRNMPEDALKAYISAFKIEPTSVGALSALSHFTAEQSGLDLCGAIDEAREAINPHAATSRLILGFAKARALDKAKEYEMAWRQAVKANADFRSYHRVDTAARTDFVKEPGPGFKNLPNQGEVGSTRASDQPLFIMIVGMPRSGKSTTERLMGNIPGVKQGFENNIIHETVADFNERIGFESTGNWDDPSMNPSAEFQKIFQDKLADRAGDCPAYTVVTPATHVLNNIPNIFRIMPNALMVFVDRDIWDNVLRIFLFNYETGKHNYSYRLSSILEQIRLWRSAMDWWSKAEPERCLTVRYEDLVADPQFAASRICSFCDLPFPDTQVDPPFDDRGCAEPYRELMEACLKEEGAQA